MKKSAFYVQKLLFLVSMICIALIFGQCQKSENAGPGLPDEDSDRPSWAGGNTDTNDHIKGNDDSGTTRGGDYGDLYELLRDDNGVPEMVQIGEEYYVQPVDVNGETLELDAEGELVDPLAAIPVEFGRLNIVRSPQSVLDQALGEALLVINAGEKFTVDFCGRITIWNTDVDGNLVITKTIDSPRESMAIYQEIMNHGFDGQLTALLNSGLDPYLLAASSFAAGSDKTGTVNIDEVVYINGFMGCEGCDPIENENEYDFNNNLKHYFDFENLNCVEDNAFVYDRAIYESRYIKILMLDPGGTYNYVISTVRQAMEDRGLFTYRWIEGEQLTLVDGFAAAVDDAVQVLEFIHGDSNIEFLPEYVPE
ncbi:hypothetical protein [Mangrovibacterium lignilyticum]|uniref:hypothetical protein n=1 Tax=Mangrovibacterium lignilyticum TaxID=2668052 RepID=UPI0013D434F2|nr:hypothetical protein [Mangrovibacterium lignilyticum]